LHYNNPFACKDLPADASPVYSMTGLIGVMKHSSGVELDSIAEVKIQCHVTMDQSHIELMNRMRQA
jgi:hypothetical protein